MRKIAIAALAGAMVLAVPALSETTSERQTVITAARYLDVQTGKYVEHPAIFVGADGRITAIADARTVRWGSGVKHIDMGEKTLLPGLIDMHVHLDSPANIGGFRSLEYTDSFFAMTAVSNGRAMLDAGFTTVRNVGASNRNDIGLAQAVSQGYVVGPRIVAAGHALGATGGHCDQTGLPPSMELPGKMEGVGDTPEELRYQVRLSRPFELIDERVRHRLEQRSGQPGHQPRPERRGHQSTVPRVLRAAHRLDVAAYDRRRHRLVERRCREGGLVAERRVDELVAREHHRRSPPAANPCCRSLRSQRVEPVMECFAGIVEQVVEVVVEHGRRSESHRQSAPIMNATSRIGASPWFRHAWLVPRWITQSPGSTMTEPSSSTSSTGPSSTST